MRHNPYALLLMLAALSALLLLSACGGDDDENEDPIECGEGTGNEIGIGKPCTKGGGECPDDTDCDVDLDPQGTGICISLMCAEDSECGSRAKCCMPDQAPFKVCLPDECLPVECGGTP